MSIIADTLKRLQTQSEYTLPESRDELPLRPSFNQGEGSGRHCKESPFRFLMIGGAITIGLSGLALSTFWSGWQLGLDVSNYTHSQMTNSHESPAPPLPLNVQDMPEKPLETVIATIPVLVQPPPTPVSLVSEEDIPSTSIAAIDSSSIQHLSTQDTSSIQRPSTSPTTSVEPGVASSTHDQDAHSLASEQSANNNKDQIALSESMTEEPTAVFSSVDELIPQEEHLYTDENNSQETKEQGATNPVAATLENEIIYPEKLVKTSKPITDSASIADIWALETRGDSTNHAVPTTGPLPSLPTNQLRKAQQLIRTGKYEDAVTLLSPLFRDPPAKWQPWFWMGTALLGKGDMEQADQFFLSGLARDDKVPQLWIQRALVAQQRGDYQLAIHELRQAESLEANLPHIHLNMGYAYEQLGNKQLANQYYGKFLKFSEGKPAFFSTRKKLFARLTRQTPTVKLSPLPSPKP